PIIRHIDSEKQVLNRVSDVFNIQKFFSIRMVDIQISGKSTTTNTSLRNRIHSRIKKFHETHSSATFSVIRNSTSSFSQISEITRGSASDFGLHNHLSQFVSNIFDTIRNVNIETRNWQSSFGSHICPNRRT